MTTADSPQYPRKTTEKRGGASWRGVLVSILLGAIAFTATAEEEVDIRIYTQGDRVTEKRDYGAEVSFDATIEWVEEQAEANPNTRYYWRHSPTDVERIYSQNDPSQPENREQQQGSASQTIKSGHTTKWEPAYTDSKGTYHPGRYATRDSNGKMISSYIPPNAERRSSQRSSNDIWSWESNANRSRSALASRGISNSRSAERSEIRTGRWVDGRYNSSGRYEPGHFETTGGRHGTTRSTTPPTRYYYPSTGQSYGQPSREAVRHYQQKESRAQTKATREYLYGKPLKSLPRR